MLIRIVTQNQCLANGLAGYQARCRIETCDGRFLGMPDRTAAPSLMAAAAGEFQAGAELLGDGYDGVGRTEINAEFLGANQRLLASREGHANETEKQGVAHMVAA